MPFGFGGPVWGGPGFGWGPRWGWGPGFGPGFGWGPGFGFNRLDSLALATFFLLI